MIKKPQHKSVRKPKTDKQKAIDRLDKLFSEYIRKRAMKLVGGCQRCKTPKTDYKQLDCAHNESRNKKSVRWHEDNAAGLCGGCHRYIDDNAADKVEFFRNLVGDFKYDALRMEAQLPSHWSMNDYNLIEIYLRQLLNEIR